MKENIINLFGFNIEYDREIIPDHLKFDIDLLYKISFNNESISIGYAKEKQGYKKEIVLMHSGFTGIYFKKIFVINKHIANNFIKHFGIFEE